MINFIALIITLTILPSASGCTNLLVSKGASADGSNIISYNADASNFYTTIYHYPAASYENGTMRKLWSWDYGTYLGEIPEATSTYNVVGNINEHGLVITESTFGGLSELTCTQRTGTVDYGSLIWITLQRSKTAREAIATMDFLVSTYGYASTGESFSIADRDELWYMELIGKGRFAKGAVWVARKVPDGYVTGHANQARITTFPLTDSENCLYSKDVISFARDIGLYSGSDEAFSFSDTYDPVTFSGARFCEARVWSFFTAVMGTEWSNQYLDYAQGVNLSNRMPLWVKPTSLIAVEDVMQYMRSHYEQTALDMSGHTFSDVGAGAFSAPVRASPLTWSASDYKGKQFFHERAIAQGPTGWSIVCQARPNLPDILTALMWFGIDDSSTSVHFPVYGSATRVSKGWSGGGPQDGVTPPMMTFSLDSAFYVFNLVANWAYTRWDAIYPDVLSEILQKESNYRKMVAQTDAAALALLQKPGQSSDAVVVEMLTSFSEEIGVQLLSDWFSFFGRLFVKYRDGFITTAKPAAVAPVCGCDTSSLPYQDEWYNRIVADTGSIYQVPKNAAADSKRWTPIDKKELRAFN
eukprot:gene22225-30466_t